MAFVLDASITAAWALADEASPLAQAAAERLKSEPALAPWVWWYEIRNTLLIAERRRRITLAESTQFLELMSAYPIQIDPDLDEQMALRLARRFGLSFYDAAYLSIASRDHLPLATLDKALASAARQLGVALLE